MIKKLPKCKYCHKLGHYESSCYKKAWDYRLNRGKMRSKPIQSRSKVVVGQKKYKLSSAEQNERRRLIRELDRYTSLYVRLNGADVNGIQTCYTCGKRIYWRSLDNGHFCKRRRLHTRWDIANCRPQCIKDNRELNGRYDVYEPKIRAELGEKDYWELIRKSRRTDKIPTYMLEEWLKIRKKEFHDLVDERKRKGFAC